MGIELKGRCDLSPRGVHLPVEPLAKAGAVRDIADHAGERVWACDLSFLPPCLWAIAPPHFIRAI